MAKRTVKMKTSGTGPFENDWAQHQSADTLAPIVESVAEFAKEMHKAGPNRWPDVDLCQMVRADIAILYAAHKAGAWVDTDWKAAGDILSRIAVHPKQREIRRAVSREYAPLMRLAMGREYKT